MGGPAVRSEYQGLAICWKILCYCGAMFRKLFAPPSKEKKKAAPSCSRLLYAIGDIHGRYDLLVRLLDVIEEDIAQTKNVSHPPIIVFLGDYIDRGAFSRDVVDCIVALQRRKDIEVQVLKGNHEQALLLFLDDAEIGAAWLVHGAAPTLSSYGVSLPGLRPDRLELEKIRNDLIMALGQEHLLFYKELKLYFAQDDYAFVHAGIRWGAPVDRQAEEDLLWIRQGFLDSEAREAHVVVHGHTPSETVYIGPNRIGVDTGAYATGVLSAIRLYGDEQTVIQCR
jgi:serine/threonine protein phosphatase 1